jgi:hypothetical protein
MPAVRVSVTLPLELLGDGEGSPDGWSEPRQLARALVVDRPQALDGLVLSRRGITRQSAMERGELPPEVEGRRPARAVDGAQRFVGVAKRFPDRLVRQRGGVDHL